MSVSGSAERRAACFASLVAAAALLDAPATAQIPSEALVAVMRGDTTVPVLAIIDLHAPPAAVPIVARVPLSADPNAVDVSADGRFAFVANTNSDARVPHADSISVIDLGARKEIRSVPTGGGSAPRDLHVAGGNVHFTLEGFRSIGRYDPLRDTIEWTLGLGQRGLHILAVSRDGNTIVTTNPDSNNVSIVTDALKGPSGWDVVHLTVGRRPQGVDISPDGKEAWVTNEAAHGVSIIDLARKLVIQHLDLDSTHASQLKFSPDGRRVLVVDRYMGELVFISAPSRTLDKKLYMPDSVPMSGGNHPVHGVAFSRDGARAYVPVNGPPGRSYIAVVDVTIQAFARQWRIATGAPTDGMALVATETWPSR